MERNEETIAEKEETGGDWEQCGFLKTQFWQSLFSVWWFSKSKIHQGKIQTMDCISVPQHHSGPLTHAHRAILREMLSVLSFSACLPAAKPEWRWQGEEWGRQRQTEPVEEANKQKENCNKSKQALQQFNTSLTHYSNLACVSTSIGRDCQFWSLLHF